ncbi:MAG: tol-pal system protein YbgF [Methylovulum sp.]|nr:tol-pal system protein YbgF [Methylovulum sp.]
MKHRFVFLLCACISVYTNAHALPEVIDNSAYPPSAIPATSVIAASPSTNTLIEITVRMEQLQSEVQLLTGKVEEQANLIAELKKHQSTLYSDFDERIQQIENKANGSAAPVVSESTEISDTASEPSAKSIDAQATETPLSENAPTEKPVNTPPKTEVAPVSDAENQDYQQAYIALRKGQTNQSIADFNAYLSKYPNGGLAGNAQYWLGEAYRVNQDNDAARKAFNDVIEKYPGSAKVPDALLKLGYVEMDQKNADKAREYFTRVTTDFPDSASARLASKKLLLLNTNN